jgi:hypothetical protein
MGFEALWPRLMLGVAPGLQCAVGYAPQAEWA